MKRSATESNQAAGRQMQPQQPQQPQPQRPRLDSSVVGDGANSNSSRDSQGNRMSILFQAMESQNNDSNRIKNNLANAASVSAVAASGGTTNTVSESAVVGVPPPTNASTIGATETADALKNQGKNDDDDNAIVSYPKPKNFAERLMYVLEKGLAGDCLYWVAGGKAVGLYPKHLKKGDALKKHFNVKDYSGFIRNCNRWGFRRVNFYSVPDGVITYQNSLFQRDQPHLVKHMRMDSDVQDVFARHHMSNSSQSSASVSQCSNPQDIMLSKKRHAPQQKPQQKQQAVVQPQSQQQQQAPPQQQEQQQQQHHHQQHQQPPPSYLTGSQQQTLEARSGQNMLNFGAGAFSGVQSNLARSPAPQQHQQAQPQQNLPDTSSLDNVVGTPRQRTLSRLLELSHMYLRGANSESRHDKSIRTILQLLVVLGEQHKQEEEILSRQQMQQQRQRQQQSLDPTADMVTQLSQLIAQAAQQQQQLQPGRGMPSQQEPQPQQLQSQSSFGGGGGDPNLGSNLMAQLLQASANSNNIIGGDGGGSVANTVNNTNSMAGDGGSTATQNLLQQLMGQVKPQQLQQQPQAPQPQQQMSMQFPFRQPQQQQQQQPQALLQQQQQQQPQQAGVPQQQQQPPPQDLLRVILALQQQQHGSQ